MIKKLRYLFTLMLLLVASVGWGEEVFYTLDGTKVYGNAAPFNAYAQDGGFDFGYGVKRLFCQEDCCNGQGDDDCQDYHACYAHRSTSHSCSNTGLHVRYKLRSQFV